MILKKAIQLTANDPLLIKLLSAHYSVGHEITMYEYAQNKLKKEITNRNHLLNQILLKKDYILNQDDVVKFNPQLGKIMVYTEEAEDDLEYYEEE